nr:ribose-phosphate diphosphokinase [Ramlibacter paludis]
MVLSLPGAAPLGAALAERLRCPAVGIEVHRFPDGESGVRLPVPVEGMRVVLAAQLEQPDGATWPLLFAADAARELGAVQVGLVVPYLPYMRQDMRFCAGEAITSRSYAKLLSRAVDFLVTVDPHLHRWRRLEDIYDVPARVVPAAPAIAGWLAREAPGCILVGPDAESEQWVADVAARAGVPFAVLRKERLGDHDVRIQLPSGVSPAGRLPVLLDDIVSSGGTLVAAAAVLRESGWRAPLAVATHALIGPEGVEALCRAGIRRLVSCDTVPHPSNAIGVRGLLAEAVEELLA